MSWHPTLVSNVFRNSANLSMDLMNLNRHHSSARKLFNTAQCGGWNDIIFVLYHCRKASRERKMEGGVEEVSHMFCFQVGQSILCYLYLFWSSLCDTYCVLLFVDYMMNLEGCVSVVECGLTLLMLCFGVSVTNHELSNCSSCLLMYLVVIVDTWAPACGMWVVILSINVCVMSFHYPWDIICRVFCSFILLFLL